MIMSAKHQKREQKMLNLARVESFIDEFHTFCFDKRQAQLKKMEDFCHSSPNIVADWKVVRTVF